MQNKHPFIHRLIIISLTVGMICGFGVIYAILSSWLKGSFDDSDEIQWEQVSPSPSEDVPTQEPTPVPPTQEPTPVPPTQTPTPVPPTQTPTPVPPTPEPTPVPPVQDPSSDWRLLLVNPWNKIPEGYQVTLTQLANGQAVDKRAYPELQQMMDDCRAAGLSPTICSSFRTRETQQQLFDNKVSRLMATGLSRETAKIEAAKVVAVPDTSEHQLGLALDIIDKNYPFLDEAQEDTAAQQWLMENSWKYGYILRYPNEKSDVTGIIYEPWHYRYVGKEAAKEIYEQGICLEEYLEQK